MRTFSEFNAFVRWLASEDAVKQAGIRARDDLYAAYAVAGTILGAGLIVIVGALLR